MFDEEIPYGSTGAKSVYMLQPFFRLTREEAMCIRWFEGALDGLPGYPCTKAFEKWPLAYFTHAAHLLAAYTGK